MKVFLAGILCKRDIFLKAFLNGDVYTGCSFLLKMYLPCV